MADPQFLYSELLAEVEAQHARAKAGEEVVLKGVELQVRTLCEQVAALPEAERKVFLPKLEALFAAFTALGNRLVEERDALASQGKALSMNQRANVAYQKSGAMAPKDTDDE